MDKDKKDNIHVPGFVDSKNSSGREKKVHKTDFVLPFAPPKEVEEPVLTNPSPRTAPNRSSSSKSGSNRNSSGISNPGKNTMRKTVSNDRNNVQSYSRVLKYREKTGRGVWFNGKLLALIIVPIFIILAVGLFGRITGNRQNGRVSNVSASLPEDGNNSPTIAETVKADQNVTAAFTTQPPYEKNNNVICIDAGHGGSDPGAERGKTYEKDQVLGVAMLVKENLEQAGYEVVLTRDSDMFISLEDRVRIAEAANAGVLVSIHRNYYKPGELASGVECWIHNSNPKDAQSLCSMIMGEINKLGLSNDRGIKTGTIEDPNENYKINKSQCTSCILELGFITNSKDDALVTGSRSKCAKAIADGIDKYVKSVKY